MPLHKKIIITAPTGKEVLKRLSPFPRQYRAFAIIELFFSKADKKKNLRILYVVKSPYPKSSTLTNRVHKRDVLFMHTSLQETFYIRSLLLNFKYISQFLHVLLGVHMIFS